jgi:hypothetical protein
MNYQKIYDQICQRAKSELEYRKHHKKNGGYYEGHHIIPNCLGGTGHSKNWNHENIVPLTAREHFICHWILHNINPDNIKLFKAFWMMCKVTYSTQCRYVPSSRIVELYKLEYLEVLKNISQETRDKMSKSKLGRKLTEEHKRKIGEKSCSIKRKPMSDSGKLNISKSKIGKFLDKKTKDKISKSNKGKIRSEESKLKYRDCKLGKSIGPQSIETIEKRSLAMKGKIQVQITCPHCGKKGGNTMSRWHFDNCKNLKK